MNRKLIIYVLCVILRMEAVVLVPALIIALFQHEAECVRGFLWTILFLAAASVATLFDRPEEKVVSARDGYFICGITWILVSAFGCLPFVLSGWIPNFVDAFFETVSGFTTTGATILQDIEALPMSLLYWRSFTHWLGGMGVLVLVLAIMPLSRRSSGSTINLLRAESPGPVVDKLVPRMGQSAKILYFIYIGLTILQILLLLAGGLSVFESVTTAFGTAGTGGFAVLNDSLASYSPYIQNVVTVFMILFGVNFNIFYLLICRQWYAVLGNVELWTYLGLMFGSVFLIWLNIMPMFPNAAETFHHAAFQVASVMTTTGFATVDFNTWPEFSKMLLIFLMFAGASAGSTGGGIKTARLVILSKAFARDIRRIARPRSVAIVRIGRQKLDEDVIHGTQSYFVVYMFIMLISMLLISINDLSFATTTTSVITCLNNVGPGLDLVGPSGNYALFTNFSKIVLAADMLIGRLEIFPVLMLFAPGAYRS